MFLLDTNVCVQYLRGKNVLIRQRLSSCPSRDIFLCSVVLAELLLGAQRSANPAKKQADVHRFVAPFASLPFDDSAAVICSTIRHQLESLGTPIGPYDLQQIAAIALAKNCTLVTHNVSEFRRVPGLLVEDWEVP
jgi:tRNA(fMet)-specific endonuclease VapC